MKPKPIRVNIFKFNRFLRDRLGHGWMVVCFIFISLFPFFLGTGLLYKSAGILEDNSIWHLLVSKDWGPLSGHLDWLHFSSVLYG